jgi:hypothetical protein
MSLIDNIEETSGLTSDGSAVETGTDAILDQVHAAEGDNSSQSEEQGDAHTDGGDAGKAASDLGPEGGDKGQESLVENVDENPENSARNKDDEGQENAGEEGKEGEEGEKTEGGEQELSDEEKAAIQADLLGTDPVDVTLDPAIRERLAEKDRYISKIEQERSDYNAELASLFKNLGRKVITTENGLQLVVSDDAKDFKAEDIDLTAVVNSLTDKEKALFGSDDEAGDPQAAAKVIAEKMASVFASQVPPITAKPQDEVLTSSQRNDVYYDFISEKLGDGQTLRFPDCEKPEVRDMVEQALAATDARMTSLHKAAQKDVGLQSALLELAWLRVHRVRQATMTLVSAEKKNQAEKTNESKNVPSVKGSGKGKNAAKKVEKSSSEKIEDFISDVAAGKPGVLHPGD